VTPLQLLASLTREIWCLQKQGYKTSKTRLASKIGTASNATPVKIFIKGKAMLLQLTWQQAALCQPLLDGPSSKVWTKCTAGQNYDISPQNATSYNSITICDHDAPISHCPQHLVWTNELLTKQAAKQ